MYSQGGMRINLDIQTGTPHKLDNFKLKLNTSNLKGSLDIQKRNNSSSKQMRTARKDKVHRLPSDTSRLNLSKLYGNLKKVKRSMPFETDRKKIASSNEEKRLSFNSPPKLAVGKNRCEVVVVNGENRQTRVLTVGRVGEMLEVLRGGDKNIATYVTVPTNLTYDFYLTQEDRDASFLNGQTVVLRPYYRSEKKKIDMKCFDIIKCIGAGGFSKVFLVRFKQDGKFYAMKLIDKHFIAQNNKQGIVQNQRNIMAEVTHPFILQLKFAFQSADFLVFVLEYCPGGELFTYVKRFKRMPEDVARFYMMEILLGIEHLHGLSIVYRDIKPENILIDMDGHVRIADFGLAKPNIGRTEMAYSFCGSPEYMAPEMILKMGHGPAVDFYCIGALLYELVTGLPPYYSKNTEQIYQAVLTEDLTFPRHTVLSHQCQSIIAGLLNKNFKQRLGAMFGVKEVLAHPWFGRFKRQEVLDKRLTPPVKIDDYESIQAGLERKRPEDAEMMTIINDQKKSQSQYFRKLMKNFYYDNRHTKLSTPADLDQQTDSRPTLRLYQKIQQRYLSPRDHIQTTSRSSYKLKKVPRLKHNESGGAILLPKDDTSRGFRKIPITKLKETYNKTFRG